MSQTKEMFTPTEKRFNLAQGQNVSHFHLTINPRQKVDVVSEEMLAQAYVKVVEQFQEGKLIYYKKGGPQDLINIEVKAARVEIGPKYGFTHLHTLICFIHSANITLHTYEIAEFVRRELGLTTAVNVQSKYVPDELAMVAKYVNKESNV